MITIYGLVSNNEPNNIKYVGITRRNPFNRLKSHKYDATKYPDQTPKQDGYLKIIVILN